MAPKIFQLLSLIFLLFVVFSAISHAKRDIPSDKKSSPFDFVEQLNGCHKGNNKKGIHQLKTYLKAFGYLEYLDRTHANDDDFDDALESAVKTYQQNHHIKPTGVLDATTISKMRTPRCGVPDIVNGTNYMQPRTPGHPDPRWPSSRTHLYYRFLPNTPTNAMAPVARAFQKWASATHFTFSRVQNNQNADLVIEFHRRDHGDGSPFDGPGGTLAHAFAPTDGRFHYDVEERWSVGQVANAYDLETVALHEIGHLLGLGHSSVEAAIMFSGIPAGATKNLDADDIQGIRALYNV